MFETILCPIDGSDHARKALRLATDLAKASGGRLVVLHVLLDGVASEEMRRFAQIEGLERHTEPVMASLAEVAGRLDYHYTRAPEGTRALTELGNFLLEDAKRTAKSEGVERVETMLEAGDTGKAILSAQSDLGADAIVLGSRGLGDVSALFLGSTSHTVMNRAPCTVIAVK